MLLFNFSEVDFTVQEGDRIAQLIVERVSFSLLSCLLFLVHAYIYICVCIIYDTNALSVQIYTPEVTVVEELEESVRGAGGFGSTGTN